MHLKHETTLLSTLLTFWTCIITGKSLSEALIFAWTNPQYDGRLFIELQVQYMKILSSNLGRTCFVQKLFLTFRTIFVHNILSPCSAKRRASDKDLPVSTQFLVQCAVTMSKTFWIFCKTIWTSPKHYAISKRMPLKTHLAQWPRVILNSNLSFLQIKLHTKNLELHTWKNL